MKHGYVTSGFRSLTDEEVRCVSGGRGNPAEQAFVGAAGAAGAWAGAVVGTSSGAEFGGLIGAIACAPAGPEASAACATVGAVIGTNYGAQIAGMTGLAAGVYIGQQIWNSLEDSGIVSADFTTTDSNTQLYNEALSAPTDTSSEVGADFSSYSAAFDGSDYSGSDFSSGDFSGGGGSGGADWGGGQVHNCSAAPAL